MSSPQVSQQDQPSAGESAVTSHLPQPHQQQQQQQQQQHVPGLTSSSVNSSHAAMSDVSKADSEPLLQHQQLHQQQQQQEQQQGHQNEHEFVVGQKTHQVRSATFGESSSSASSSSSSNTSYIMGTQPSNQHPHQRIGGGVIEVVYSGGDSNVQAENQSASASSSASQPSRSYGHLPRRSAPEQSTHHRPLSIDTSVITQQQQHQQLQQQSEFPPLEQQHQAHTSQPPQSQQIHRQPSMIDSGAPKTGEAVTVSTEPLSATSESGIRGDPEACLFVASLNNSLSDVELQNSVSSIFSQWGKLLHVKVQRDSHSRPYAFVQYNDINDARKALDHSKGVLIEGRPARVEIARVNRILYVEGFDKSLDDDSLRNMVTLINGEQRGLEEFIVPKDSADGDNKGILYVKYCYREDAVDAIRFLRTNTHYAVGWATSLSASASTPASASTSILPHSVSTSTAAQTPTLQPDSQVFMKQVQGTYHLVTPASTMPRTSFGVSGGQTRPPSLSAGNIAMRASSSVHHGRGHSGPSQDRSTLFVGNLDRTVTEEMLLDYFVGYGVVEHIQIIHPHPKLTEQRDSTHSPSKTTDQPTDASEHTAQLRYPPSYAFVRFSDEESAKCAISDRSRPTLLGRTVRLFYRQNTVPVSSGSTSATLAGGQATSSSSSFSSSTAVPLSSFDRRWSVPASSATTTATAAVRDSAPVGLVARTGYAHTHQAGYSSPSQQPPLPVVYPSAQPQQYQRGQVASPPMMQSPQQSLPPTPSSAQQSGYSRQAFGRQSQSRPAQRSRTNHTSSSTRRSSLANQLPNISGTSGVVYGNQQWVAAAGMPADAVSMVAAGFANMDMAGQPSLLQQQQQIPSLMMPQVPVQQQQQVVSQYGIGTEQVASSEDLSNVQQQLPQSTQIPSSAPAPVPVPMMPLDPSALSAVGGPQPPAGVPHPMYVPVPANMFMMQPQPPPQMAGAAWPVLPSVGAVPSSSGGPMAIASGDGSSSVPNMPMQSVPMFMYMPMPPALPASAQTGSDASRHIPQSAMQPSNAGGQLAIGSDGSVQQIPYGYPYFMPAQMIPSLPQQLPQAQPSDQSRTGEQQLQLPLQQQLGSINPAMLGPYGYAYQAPQQMISNPPACATAGTASPASATIPRQAALPIQMPAYFDPSASSLAVGQTPGVPYAMFYPQYYTAAASNAPAVSTQYQQQYQQQQQQQQAQSGLAPASSPHSHVVAPATAADNSGG
ncbi:hypothetical protein GQ42DRAFT_81321 [Ramicandelaber brevisporus]|nr:hypothetical protein GQ42DRAFT_81321 [Ramicandelaber brevisporus]